MTIKLYFSSDEDFGKDTIVSHKPETQKELEKTWKVIQDFYYKGLMPRLYKIERLSEFGSVTERIWF